LRSVVPNEHGIFANRNITLFAGKTISLKLPPLIEYPEDKLRITFYKDHPFELDRSLAINDKSAIWVDIYGGPHKTNSSLTGEKYSVYINN
jgi:hypothetical protein